jgi:hypothetical protein
MLSIFGQGNIRDCQRLSRRELLRVGSLAFGGTAFSQILSSVSAASNANKLLTDKAVVFLFLQGGPSQIETFDPKPEAPVEIRSIMGMVDTQIPGVQFGGTFPKLAARNKRFSILRSFASGNGDHQNYMTVAGGDNPFKAPMGTVYARVAGSNHPESGMPRNVIVTPEAAQPGLKLGSNFETQSLQKLIASSQAFGASYSFFDPSGGNDLRKNMELKLANDRFDDRRNMLAQLDTFKRQMDRTRMFDTAATYQQQAFDVIIKGVSEAFDLSKEDPKCVEHYDTSKLFKLEEVTKWGDMRRSSNLLGKQMLLARRLVEAGCGFVTVMDAGWDMHSNGNSPKNLDGMKWLGHQVDHAVAAFLDDVADRGLSDKILLVVSGEMGRTPKINKNGGRDHWGNLTPLLVAGGGLKMGQVIGRSDSQGGTPASKKYTPKNLFQTVMETALHVGEVRVSREVPKNVVDLMGTSEPIAELMS